MKKKWNDRLRDALAAAAQPDSLTGEEEQVIADFTTFYDAMSFDAIVDNTILARPREVDAWFRMIELLRELPDEQLHAEDVERVGFRQLYEQPKEYRGKLVRVRGKVRRAARVRAPSNDLGIQEYFIFWLLPAGGPTSPIVIYSLDIPDGFPEIENQALEDEYFNIDEFMEFTGYSYKRYAYPAAGGSLLAPVMLSRAPQWTPQVEEDLSLPPWHWIVAAVVAMGIVAAGVASFIYRRSGNVPTAEEMYPGLKTRADPSFNVSDDELTPTPSEHLANLETAPEQTTIDGEEEQA